MSGAEFHRRAMEDALTDAAEQTSVDRKAVALAEAQVHAAALLAEEQRTANLIALFDEEGPEVFHEPLGTTAPERKASADRIRAKYLALAEVVAARLDLA